MQTELAVMRVFHILAGVVWAGSAIFLAVVLLPRLRTVGPEVRGPVIAALAPALRAALDGSGAVTILVGVLLLLRMDRLGALFNTNWGLAITVGLVASVLAFASGAATLSLMKRRPEATAVSTLARITAALVVLATATMASARFV